IISLWQRHALHYSSESDKILRENKVDRDQILRVRSGDSNQHHRWQFNKAWMAFRIEPAMFMFNL
uniref:hypothetical protein n=1 Tax=Salmonella sp. s55884 TaxID=3159683 RepID=UPI0039801760